MPELLTRREICKLLKIGRSTSYRIGLPEPVEIGPQTFRWPRGVIEDWLRSRGVEVDHQTETAATG